MLGCLVMLVGLFANGCQQFMIDRADRSVYRAIEDRQRATLGAASNAHVGAETGDVRERERMYSFTPRPIGNEVPPEFQTHERAPTAPLDADSASAPPDTDAAFTPSIFSDDQLEKVQVFGLRDTLAYAMRQARSFQDAKEDLYLAGLALTLERHLWTPQFVGAVHTEYANYGQVRDFDHAMTAVSDVSATQRLPYGGEVSARVMNTLMRDLGAHVTSGESGSTILAANIPLLRGAGPAAYESRYQAERDLIYSVRTFEQFRRSFLVDVAARYFDLQQSKASVGNTYTSYLSRRQDWEKADFIQQMGQSRTIFDAPRAKASLRQSQAALVSAKEQYASNVDQFKVFIGMSLDMLLDVVDQDADENSKALDGLLPNVDQTAAEAAALHYRLDLLNSADRVDDRKRGVLVAKNRILPELNAGGSATLDTDLAQKNSASYNTERTTWRGSLDLRVNDRKTERNAYRASLINLRRGERDHQQFEDNVRTEVRRAIRRLAQQKELRAIQTLNVEENEFRLDAAREQFNQGRITNRDVVDAETDLLVARNQLAGAVAAYRNAILAFRRDTGTLRVTDEGRLDAN